jgi:hypothetical protein
MIWERMEEIELGQQEIPGDDRWKGRDGRRLWDWKTRIGKKGMEWLDKGKKGVSNWLQIG